MSNHDLSMQFFLQLAAILGTIRLVGLLVRRIGQPQVVGEMIAGVLLGLLSLASGNRHKTLEACPPLPAVCDCYV